MSLPVKAILAFFVSGLVLAGVDRYLDGLSAGEASLGMSYIVHYEDFEFVRYSGNVLTQGKRKDIYIQKNSGKHWLLSEHFGFYEFASYVAGGLYKLMLQDRVPNIALIKKQDGSYSLGSEFISNFQNMGEFFGEKDTDLIAYSHKAGAPGTDDLPPLSAEQSAYIQEHVAGIEDVIAAAIILGDNDLHKKNLGVIPSKKQPGKYVFAKVDHDMCFHLLQYLETLSKQKVPVFERFFLDPATIDLKALSAAFERIAQIDDRLWEQSIRERLADLRETGAFDEETFHIYEHARWWEKSASAGDRDILSVMMERKSQAASYAKSLKVEACIKSGDLASLQQLLSDGSIVRNEKFHSLFLAQAMAGPISLDAMAEGYQQTAILEYLNTLAL